MPTPSETYKVTIIGLGREEADEMVKHMGRQPGAAGLLFRAERATEQEARDHLVTRLGAAFSDRPLFGG